MTSAEEVKSKLTEDVREFSEDLSSEDLYRYLLFKHVPKRDCDIIKEECIPGLCFLGLSKEDWKDYGLSRAGVVAVSRLQEMVKAKAAQIEASTSPQVSEKKQRSGETVSEQQVGLERRPQGSYQNRIPDTDPVPFHDSNKKERETTKEDKDHVLSHDERPKGKYIGPDGMILPLKPDRKHGSSGIRFSPLKSLCILLILSILVTFSNSNATVNNNTRTENVSCCSRMLSACKMLALLLLILCCFRRCCCCCGGGVFCKTGTPLLSPKESVRQIWKTEFIITDKYDLFEATKEIGDWFTLCTSLRVSQAVMNDLRNTAGENLRKRQDCLTSYFNKKPKTLWKEVVQVIAESMENRRLACEIAKKHMKWEEKDCELAFSNSPRTEL